MHFYDICASKAFLIGVQQRMSANNGAIHSSNSSPRILCGVRWIAFSPEVGAYLNSALFVLRTLARTRHLAQPLSRRINRAAIRVRCG